MRSILRLAALSLLGAATARALPAQTPLTPAVRAELVAAREAVWRAYFTGDSAALVRLLPATMVAMQDRAAIIRDARAYVASGGRYVGITFTEDQFFVEGNTAVVWSRYRVQLTSKAGEPEIMAGRAIELFVRRDGRWLNPHWHLDGEK